MNTNFKQSSAYELADKLEWHWDNDCRSPAVSKSANMLRQQADRIAELEELLKIDGDEIKILQSLLKEKQNEPVAWMQIHYKDNVPTKFSPVKVWEDDIPLFTTPQTKPLSDEEIEEIENQCRTLPPKPWKGVPIGQFDYKQFARAIEERHGIK